MMSAASPPALHLAPWLVAQPSGAKGGLVDFESLRARLDLAAVAEGEGLQVWRCASRLAFVCPSCGKGDSHGSGALSKDGVRWYCVRCEERGDAIDLIRFKRGIDSRIAMSEASILAGLGNEPRRYRPRGAWRPAERRALTVTATPLEDADLAERLRAVRLAALHYRYLSELDDGEDWPTAASHIDHLAEFGAFNRRHVRRSAALQTVPDLQAGRIEALTYLRERIGVGWDEARPIIAELVGICPALDSGLRGFLRTHGGGALVAAGERAGLFRRNGAERFAGRLVYLWTNESGRVEYLTGRAVLGLVDGCRIRRDVKGEVQKGEALPVFNPERRNDRLGVLPPTVPFGGHLAARAGGTVRIVEGELDAIAELVGGAAIATGGTARMHNRRGLEALRRFLRGRPAIVAFDRENDPVKQARTDKRGFELAQAIGARWVPGEVG